MRIAWVSPMTPASGVGSFSQAVTRSFPASIDGEPIDLTILHPPHPRLHRSRHRTLPLGSAADLAPGLGLFDAVVYNIGAIVSYFVSPYMADTLGRKPTIMIGCAIMIGGACITTFCTGYGSQ